MASFPAYVKVGWKDSGEQPGSIVERTEMDRGIAKQRRTQADLIITVPLTAYFGSNADATSFETWVYTTLNGGMDWFTFTSLRTGGTVDARIVGGDIGTLKPATGSWSRSQRSFSIEYVRSAL